MKSVVMYEYSYMYNYLKSIVKCARPDGSEIGMYEKTYNNSLWQISIMV